jgi:hypothetical protein
VTFSISSTYLYYRDDHSRFKTGARCDISSTEHSTSRQPRRPHSYIKEDFQEAPAGRGGQEVLGGLPGLLRRPDLLGLPGRRRQDHLYRPSLPQDLGAQQARETNRNHPIRV